MAEIIVNRYRDKVRDNFVEAEAGGRGDLAMANDGQYEFVCELSIGHRDSADTTAPAPVQTDVQSAGDAASGYSLEISEEQLQELIDAADVVARKQKPETIAQAKADLLALVTEIDPDGLCEACEQFRVLAHSVPAED
jgi:hypothetical protein